MRLVPTLDPAERTELLHALFPVPSAATEQASASLIGFAVARLRAEGLLKERVNGFLRRHPLFSEKIEHTAGAPPRAIPFLEAAAWVLAFVLGSAASVRAFSALPAHAGHRALQHPTIALQAIPLPASFDPPPDPVPRSPSSVSLVAPAPPRSSTPALRVAVLTRPHPKAKAFHNIDFSGYFPAVHRQPPVVAMDPPPAPAPSPTAEPPRPRVHSLFGPLFSHNGRS